MRKTMDAGVRDRVIIHCKEQAFAMNADRVLTEVPSLKIPREEIKGSVGAGDAFCAACLYGIYNSFTDRELLEFASGAAACNLFAANSVDGMRSRSGIYEVCEKYGRLDV
jgi:sugar/nucleoside kinase (ribokinase family)